MSNKELVSKIKKKKKKESDLKTKIFAKNIIDMAFWKF